MFIVPNPNNNYCGSDCIIDKKQIPFYDRNPSVRAYKSRKMKKHSVSLVRLLHEDVYCTLYTSQNRKPHLLIQRICNKIYSIKSRILIPIVFQIIKYKFHQITIRSFIMSPDATATLYCRVNCYTSSSYSPAVRPHTP